MANTNNLIRPPTPSVSQTEQNRVNMNQQELNAHISRIVSEAIASQVLRRTKPNYSASTLGKS